LFCFLFVVVVVVVVVVVYLIASYCSQFSFIGCFYDFKHIFHNTICMPCIENLLGMFLIFCIYSKCFYMFFSACKHWPFLFWVIILLRLSHLLLLREVALSRQPLWIAWFTHKRGHDHHLFLQLLVFHDPWSFFGNKWVLSSVLYHRDYL